MIALALSLAAALATPPAPAAPGALHAAVTAAPVDGATPPQAGAPATKAAKATTAKARRASPGKPRAPVRVDAQLGDGTAHVQLTFDAGARDVAVRVYGIEGLQVTSPERPFAQPEFAGGETAAADVSFTAPAGRAHLVVSVTGEFAGVRRGTVTSFAVGKPSAAQKKQQEEGVVDDGRGGKIRVQRAQER
jgi:hypothetical protein